MQVGLSSQFEFVMLQFVQAVQLPMKLTSVFMNDQALKPFRGMMTGK